MPFVPKYSHEEVERLITTGGLSALEVYRLKHQHPLNRLTHFVGIPTIAASIVFPLFAWFAWRVVAWKEWIILNAIGWGLSVFTPVAVGVLLLALSEVWRYGISLQEDVEATV